MMEVIDARFREVRTIETYSAGEEQFRRGDRAPYETQCGMEYGTVTLGNYALCSCKEENPPQAILGRTTEEDAVRAATYKSKERGALLFCQRKAEALGFDMKIISIVFSLRDDRVLFFFSANTRVDFRVPVKEFGAQYQRRTELRQVGVRNETKLLGGMGNCGRPLYYRAYLLKFIPVSIKVAKGQGLALNPQKVSGACGRLICYLKHETDTYTELSKTLPQRGDSVQLLDGVRGDVVEVSVLKQTLRAAYYVDGEEELRDVVVAKTTITGRKRKGMPPTQKRVADAWREKKTGRAAAKQREGKKRPGRRSGVPQQGRTREKKK